jgi:hypothetical protein
MTLPVGAVRAFEIAAQRVRLALQCWRGVSETPGRAMVEETGRATVVGADGIDCTLPHLVRVSGIGVTAVHAHAEKLE